MEKEEKKKKDTEKMTRAKMIADGHVLKSFIAFVKPLCKRERIFFFFSLFFTAQVGVIDGSPERPPSASMHKSYICPSTWQCTCRLPTCFILHLSYIYFLLYTCFFRTCLPKSMFVHSLNIPFYFLHAIV